MILHKYPLTVGTRSFFFFLFLLFISFFLSRHGNRKETSLRGGKIESKNWITAIVAISKWEKILFWKFFLNSFCYDEESRDDDS